MFQHQRYNFKQATRELLENNLEIKIESSAYAEATAKEYKKNLKRDPKKLK
ncbi:MAG: hypothetical protein ACI837_001502 [Crocinitomicaceae bacterium]|jgi:hypothetical protein